MHVHQTVRSNVRVGLFAFVFSLVGFTGTLFGQTPNFSVDMNAGDVFSKRLVPKTQTLGLKAMSSDEKIASARYSKQTLEITAKSEGKTTIKITGVKTYVNAGIQVPGPRISTPSGGNKKPDDKGKKSSVSRRLIGRKSGADVITGSNASYLIQVNVDKAPVIQDKVLLIAGGRRRLTFPQGFANVRITMPPAGQIATAKPARNIRRGKVTVNGRSNDDSVDIVGVSQGLTAFSGTTTKLEMVKGVGSYVRKRQYIVEVKVMWPSGEGDPLRSNPGKPKPGEDRGKPTGKPGTRTEERNPVREIGKVEQLRRN